MKHEIKHLRKMLSNTATRNDADLLAQKLVVGNKIIDYLNSFGLEALSSESTDVARGVITQFIISKHRVNIK